MNALRLLPAAVGAMVVLLAPAATEAQCATSTRSTGAIVGYDNIQLVPSGIPSTLQDAFNKAYEAWNDPDCNKQGTSFPSFGTGPAPDARVVNVIFNSGSNPRNSASCANFSGNDINIYDRALAGTQWRSCTSPNEFQDTLSHELGHLLGLEDKGSGCGGYIMSQKEISSTGAYKDREVQPDECQKVDETNTTPTERQLAGCTTPSTTGGGFGLRRAAAPLLNPCDEGTDGSGPGGTGDTRDPGSPILIDLDRGGFELTSVAGGVLFDIDADGAAEQMAWTAPGSGDAFLALDRDENRWIEDGRELFGDRTPQPPSSAPHGFLALALYDEDFDGWITTADAIFPLLRLWIDADHDGRSQPHELVGLKDAGVRAISVEPVESRRRDEHGNEFRYSALVRLRREVTQAVDVFFRVE
jgi:hypothetical protein